MSVVQTFMSVRAETQAGMPVLQFWFVGLKEFHLKGLRLEKQ